MFPPRNLGAHAPTQIRGIIASSIALGGLCLSAGAQSFNSSIDFDEAPQNFSHGDIVDPDAYGTMMFYSPRISVTPPSSDLKRAVIFDTESPQVASNTSDRDLIPNTNGNVKSQDLGNVIIIQANNGFTINDSDTAINNPNSDVDDDANGGTVTYDFNPDLNVSIDSLSLTFIDIERGSDLSLRFSSGSSTATILGTDLDGSGSAIVYGDGNANKTRFYTAKELFGSGSSFSKLEVISKTSFAVDELKITGTIPEVSSSLLALSSALVFCFRRRRKA